MNHKDLELTEAIRRIANRISKGINQPRETRLKALLKDHNTPQYRRILSPQERLARAFRLRDSIMQTLIGTHSTFANIDRALGWKRGGVRGVLWAWDLRKVTLARIVELGAYCEVDFGTLIEVCLALREIHGQDQKGMSSSVTTGLTGGRG